MVNKSRLGQDPDVKVTCDKGAPPPPLRSGDAPDRHDLQTRPVPLLVPQRRHRLPAFCLMAELPVFPHHSRVEHQGLHEEGTLPR